MSTADVVTLVIAVLGLVVAAVSLAWQVIAWRYEGARVKVQIRSAFPVLGDDLGDQHLMVEVLNVGRAAVELVGWCWDLGNDSNIPSVGAHPRSTPLPHTLPGGHRATFLMAADPVRQKVREHGAVGRARAAVSLGNGQTALSPPLKF